MKMKSGITFKDLKDAINLLRELNISDYSFEDDEYSLQIDISFNNLDTIRISNLKGDKKINMFFYYLERNPNIKEIEYDMMILYEIIYNKYGVVSNDDMIKGATCFYTHQDNLICNNHFLYLTFEGFNLDPRPLIINSIVNIYKNSNENIKLSDEDFC